MSKLKNPHSDISDGYNLLMLRAEEGNYEEVINCLSSPKMGDINAINKKGYTALAIAVKNGSREIVDVLIHEGANVNLKNNAGQSPLFLSCWCNFVEIVKLLLSKGAEINTTDQRGWSPLTIAAYHGNLDIVNLLLKNRADVMIKDSFGKRAVHRAKDQRIIKLLQQAEGMISKRQSSSRSPLDRFSTNVSYIKNDLNSSMPSKRATHASIRDDAYQTLKKRESSPDLKTKSAKDLLKNVSPGKYVSQTNRSALQYEPKSATRPTSVEKNRSMIKTTLQKLNTPPESPSRDSVGRRLVMTPNSRKSTRNSMERILPLTDSVYSERRDLEDTFTSQLKQTSDQLQAFIEQKVSFEIMKQTQKLQEKWKKAFEVTANAKMAASYKELQDTFSNHLKNLGQKLGLSHEAQNIMAYLGEDGLKLPAGVIMKQDLIRIPPGLEQRMLQNNVQKLEKAVYDPKSNRPSPKNSQGWKANLKAKTVESPNKTATEATTKRVNAMKEEMLARSKEKVEEIMASGVRALQDDVAFGLHSHVELTDNESKKKFESVLANKFHLLSEIMGNESLNSEGIIERTMTEDSFQENKYEPESKLTSQLLNDPKEAEYIYPKSATNPKPTTSDWIKMEHASKYPALNKYLVPEPKTEAAIVNSNNSVDEALNHIPTKMERPRLIELQDATSEYTGTDYRNSRNVEEMIVPLKLHIPLKMADSSFASLTPSMSDNSLCQDYPLNSRNKSLYNSKQFNGPTSFGESPLKKNWAVTTTNLNKNQSSKSPARTPKASMTLIKTPNSPSRTPKATSPSRTPKRSGTQIPPMQSFEFGLKNS